MLLCIPVLAHLRRSFPRASLAFAGSFGHGKLLECMGLVDHVFDVEDYPNRRQPFFAEQAARKSSSFDVVLAYTSRIGSWLNSLDSSVQIVQYDPKPPVGKHAAQHLLSALTLLGAAEPEWQGPGSVDSVSLASSMCPDSSATADILLHPGSGSKWKSAPASLYRQLSDALLDEGTSVSILSGPAESFDELRRIWRREPILSPASPLELASVLQKSRAVIGNDSGVTHLSGILGVPTVAIFGPTHPQTWSPIGPKVKIVRACSAAPSVEIRACMRGDCFQGVRVSSVMEELNLVLNR